MKAFGTAYNWLDITIIVILALSVIVGLFRGFIREAISLVTWVVAIVVALKFSAMLSVRLIPYIDSVAIRYIVTFIGIFFAVIIAGAIVNAIIGAIVSRVGIGFADRMIGLIFGGLRGILLVAVMLMLIDMSPLQKQNWVENSKLAPYFQPIVDWLNRFLPAQIKQVSEWMQSNVKNISIQYNNIQVTPNVRSSGNNSK